MTRRVLTQFAAGEIRRLRAEMNDWGEPKWTGLEIATATNVSESTVWRVLGKQAAYAKMGKVAPGGLSMEMAAAALANAPAAGLDAQADASLARLQTLLADVKVPQKGLLDLPLSDAAKERLATFRSPLDE